jgi:hypothetical protein
MFIVPLIFAPLSCDRKSAIRNQAWAPEDMVL